MMTRNPAERQIKLQKCKYSDLIRIKGVVGCAAAGKTPNGCGKKYYTVMGVEWVTLGKQFLFLPQGLNSLEKIFLQECIGAKPYLPRAR
jgi:hypothetical protein